VYILIIALCCGVARQATVLCVPMLATLRNAMCRERVLAVPADGYKFAATRSV